MMKSKTITQTSLILCALIVAGCSSKPREVSASLPLVSASQNKPDKKLIPQQYWLILSDPQQVNIAHEKYQIQLDELYTSALGLRCRELKLIDKMQKTERRVACETPYINSHNKLEKAWFIEKEIIESSTYIEL